MHENPTKRLKLKDKNVIGTKNRISKFSKVLKKL